MTARNYSSVAVRATLNSSIAAGDTSFAVSSVTGWPAVPFTLIIDRDLGTEEIVTATGVSGTTVTATRGEDGTTARAHDAGAYVEHGISAREFTSAYTPPPLASLTGYGTGTGTFSGATMQSYNYGGYYRAPMNAIRIGNSILVGSGGGNIRRSTDNGSTWTSTSTALAGYAYHGFSVLGTKVIAIRNDSSQSACATAETSDLSTWTQRDLPASAYWRCTASSGSVAVAVGWTANLAASRAASTTDGITWNLQTLDASGRAYNWVVWDGARFVAFCEEGAVKVSANGTTWTDGTAIDSPNSVATDGNGTIVVGHDGGYYRYSTDHGTTWTNPVWTTSVSNARTTVFYSNGYWFFIPSTSASTGLNCPFLGVVPAASLGKLPAPIPNPCQPAQFTDSLAPTAAVGFVVHNGTGYLVGTPRGVLIG